MKFNQYHKKNHRTVGLVMFTLACVFLIVGIILYQTYAIYEVVRDKNLLQGDIEEVGDIYFAFYVDDVLQKEMPKKDTGYQLDEENSTCGVMGKIDSTIKPKLNRDTWSIVVDGLNTSRTKCNLYFKKNYDSQKLYDLSTNHFDGTFMDGAIVQQDDEGNLGIYFDGQNDYVDIADIPETIDFASGFTVEFEAKWLSTDKYYSRIFELGNGEYIDNIFVANLGSSKSLAFETVYDSKEYRFTKDDYIVENQKNFYQFVYTKTAEGYSIRARRNDEEPIYKDFTGTILTNATRENNYLGKSNFTADGYFQGYIYSLKIKDAFDQVILWYDF